MELEETVRNVVTYPGEDVIESTGPDNEVIIKTSLTDEEMDALKEHRSIKEFYGLGAEYFRENPESDAELGIIFE